MINDLSLKERKNMNNEKNMPIKVNELVNKVLLT